MLKKLVERLTKPVEEVDREKLSEYCDARLLEPMDAIVGRQPIRVGGEVRSVRIVPRAGAPALEVTVTDGRGSVVGVFLGRRKVAGHVTRSQGRARGRRREERQPVRAGEPDLRAPELGELPE